jgi:putative PIN family toxin of toxin-antitoxin system
VRAVLDPNVLISALLSASGPPGQAVARWLAGEFELIVSEPLLLELEEALAYPKLRKRVTENEASVFQDLLRREAVVAPEPPAGSHHAADPDDDYLLALAEAERAVLVTGDEHLLGLSDELPILTARAFVDEL